MPSLLWEVDWKGLLNGGFLLLLKRSAFSSFPPGGSLYPQQQCSVSVWKKRSSCTYSFLSSSLPGFTVFQRLNSLSNGGWVHPSLLLPSVGGDQQATSWALTGCTLVLGQQGVISGCLLDGFKNTREKLRPTPFFHISLKIEASPVLKKG